MWSTFLGVGKLIGDGSFDCAHVWGEKRKKVKIIVNKVLSIMGSLGGVEYILGLLFKRAFKLKV